MTNNNEITSLITDQGLLPLYFHPSTEVCGKILHALYDAGVRVVEFTNRGEEARENFKQLIKTRNEKLPGLLLSAGTIKTKKDAEDYISAGADFLISPGLNEVVGRIAKERNILWIPGCMTPSEIMKAEDLGATLVKIFPGNLLGPGFVNSVKELFPGMKFMPTGGVQMEKENLTAWFNSGVIAVGAGSTLIDKKSLSSGDFKSVQERTKIALRLIAEIRKK